jgi:hypothetical protein
MFEALKFLFNPHLAVLFSFQIFLYVGDAYSSAIKELPYSLYLLDDEA